MSDTNFDEDTGVQAGQNGSSSESSDMSIEKLNPEDVDVPETKTVEDDEEVPNKVLEKWFDSGYVFLMIRSSFININIIVLHTIYHNLHTENP